MKLDTSKFEGVHGKKPQGFGLWSFDILGTDGNGSYTSFTETAYGTVSAAKAMAVKTAKSKCSAVKTIVEIVLNA